MDAIWKWIEDANAFLAPWLQQYNVARNAPLVLVILAVLGGGWWLWGMLVSGPRRRSKAREAEAVQQRKEDARDADLADVKRALAILAGKAEGGFDATTAQTLETSLANLFAAQEGAKKRASEKLLAGDRDGALSELKQFAARENEAVAKAAETQKEIGALAFPDRTDDAIAAYERAIQLAPDDVEARNQVGHLYQRVGRPTEAEAAYRHILETAGKADESWLAASLGNLGNVAHTRGDLDAAGDYHARALAIYERLDRLEGQATALGNLGLIARTRGDLDAAGDYHKGALAINESLGRFEGQAGDLGNLGLVARTRGDLDAAEDYHKRAMAIYETFDSPEGQANQLSSLGNVALMRGDLDDARDYHKRALAMNRSLGRLEGQASDLGNLGLVALTGGDLDAAEEDLKRALAMNERLGSLEGQANQLGNLGIVARTRGNLDVAEEYHKRALAINDRLGRLERQASQLGNLGNVAQARGDLAGAEAYWKRSLALYRQVGIPHMAEHVSGSLHSIGADPDKP